jgi:hypothetical protein
MGVRPPEPYRRLEGVSDLVLFRRCFRTGDDGAMPEKLRGAFRPGVPFLVRRRYKAGEGKSRKNIRKKNRRNLLAKKEKEALIAGLIRDFADVYGFTPDEVLNLTWWEMNVLCKEDAAAAKEDVSGSVRFTSLAQARALANSLRGQNG